MMGTSPPGPFRCGSTARHGKGVWTPACEAFAASLQYRHPDRGRDPVRRGHHAERAFDFRAGRERIGVDIAGHGICSFLDQAHLITVGLTCQLVYQSARIAVIMPVSAPG